jgi:hypothetical protein
MEFLTLVMRGIALLPTVIQGVETLYGSCTGERKRSAAISIVGSAIGVVEAGGSNKIVDSAKFTAGLGMIVDGVVACLNASVWAKQAVAAAYNEGHGC